jgi:hypothetical protein
MEAMGRLYSHYSAWEKFVGIVHVLTIKEYLIPTNISGILVQLEYIKASKITNTPKPGCIYIF